MRWFDRIIFFCLLWTVTFSSDALAQNLSELQLSVGRKVESKIRPILDRYCAKSCELLNIRVGTEDEITDTQNLGFEEEGISRPNSQQVVNKVLVEIQVDDRVSTLSRGKLEKILLNHLRRFGGVAEVRWQIVQHPRIGDNGGTLGNLKSKLKMKVSNALNKVVQKYCPEQCIIEKIDINGSGVTPDEASVLSPSRKVVDLVSQSAMRIDSIEVDVTMDERLDINTRRKISSLMRSHLRFASPLNLNLGVTRFPETYANTLEKSRMAQKDPYGLERLRQMLVMFRELAGTKEIITNTTSSMNSKTSNNISSKSKVSDSTELTEKSDNNTMTGSLADLTLQELAIYVAGFLILLALLAVGIIKVSKAKGDASEMVIKTGAEGGKRAASGAVADNQRADGGNTQVSNDSGKKVDIGYALKIAELKDELVNIFLSNPKVAKETFSRLLKEDGVEESAKYVHIFGHMIVFELLNDPNFQRDLYELSEFYHSSEFNFDPEEEYELLMFLKTRVTATEIKVLARKSAEKFDFLNRLDAGQIYKLISEEKVQIQSIVLTQLDRKRRNEVFEMYKGKDKIDLMSELTKAEAVPREYLFNVAKAMSKKVASHPEYDTENLRASDILIDLMEKADLSEQRNLMSTLSENNPETARDIMGKLVTIEMMPYLKDGHLLELIMGLERDDLLNFLVGTRDHISRLLLNKAPEELSDSWQEDMDLMNSVEEQNYRKAEMKIVSRIRSLSNNGVISLSEINHMIFDSSTGHDKSFIVDDGMPDLSENTYAA